jgi:hypothetical protein
MTMAKGSSDIILRDRLQFTLDANGDQTTVYGRFDLSDYVSTLERKGLSIKEINFMLRDPDHATGAWNSFGLSGSNASGSVIQTANMKVYATTRAYEAAQTVGIASPDVLCVEEWQSHLGPNTGAAPAAQSVYALSTHNEYPVGTYHPDGFPVVTDLLVGICAGNWDTAADKTLELDVMIIASPITITAKQLTEMLVQGQDQ